MIGPDGSFRKGADGDAERDEPHCSFVKASGRGHRFGDRILRYHDGRESRRNCV